MTFPILKKEIPNSIKDLETVWEKDVHDSLEKCDYNTQSWIFYFPPNVSEEYKQAAEALKVIYPNNICLSNELGLFIKRA